MDLSERYVQEFGDVFDPDVEQQQQQEPATKTRIRDVETKRPGYMVIDNVSYYKIASMCVLLYAHVTEGVSAPVIFSPQEQQFITADVAFDFGQ